MPPTAKPATPRGSSKPKRSPSFSKKAKGAEPSPPPTAEPPPLTTEPPLPTSLGLPARAPPDAGGANERLLRTENEQLREELARERKVNEELRTMLGFRQREDGFRVRSLAERNWTECYFWFVQAKLLRECKDNSLSSFQTLIEKPGWLVLKNVTLRGCCNAAYKSKYCVVSHRWEQPSEPDREGVQLGAVREHLAKNAGIEFVWYDYWCMPQGERSGGEKLEFDTMLRNVNLLYLGCSVLALVDLSYMSRFWTQFEGGRRGLQTSDPPTCA